MPSLSIIPKCPIYLWIFIILSLYVHTTISMVNTYKDNLTRYDFDPQFVARGSHSIHFGTSNFSEVFSMENFCKNSVVDFNECNFKKDMKPYFQHEARYSIKSPV